VGKIELPEKWNEGAFEVNINRCSECISHYYYSKHSEDEYVNYFNDIGEAITTIFPNAEIVGNYERPQRLEEFEVYLLGLGFRSKRDQQQRYCIFRKSNACRFPHR